MLAATPSDACSSWLRENRAPVRGPRPVCSLARGEILFQTGDKRAKLYRVESGALCHYLRWEDGRREIVEFAFPGDIVGFGHLPSHVSTVQAMVETTFSLVSQKEFDALLQTDGQLAARFAAAGDREFEYLRQVTVKADPGKPVERVASFLSALSHMSEVEGRDPTLVAHEITSGEVAEHLDLTMDMLVAALRELERRGMVSAADNGRLQIRDLPALDKLAAA
jgi:CRP/FNR family transcriptional regulator, anaerobic regulatory protein